MNLDLQNNIGMPADRTMTSILKLFVIALMVLLAGVECFSIGSEKTSSLRLRLDYSGTAVAMAKRPRGFGANPTPTAPSRKGGKKPSQSPSVPSIISESKSIQEVLNPRYKDPQVLEDIQCRLKRGQVVILPDAFQAELAEAMHQELEDTDAWNLNENYQVDGYHYRHYNIYNRADFPPICTRMDQNIFSSPSTKEFMTQLTGRDCSGDSVSGAPSYYAAGDHSLPHTDHIGQRTVAYVWHLSKNWKPEWGGALYWAQEPLANAFHHATFNSLVLFSVTPFSAHFVTTVSPNAKEKRLAYNGWWHSSWVPTAADPLEEWLATPEQRLTLTHAQVLSIQDMLDDPWAPKIQPPERQVSIEQLREKLMNELYPLPLRASSSGSS